MKTVIIMGSKSDAEKMTGAAECFRLFGIDFEAYVLSAHRVPEELGNYIRDFEDSGVECIIAGAGLAAHLPGVIASKTIIPVIGVPLKAGNTIMDGMDSLLSIVQMPPKIPVAAVGLNNSYNAAMYAVQILSLKYPELKKRLTRSRLDMKEKFISENKGGIKL